MHQSTPLRRPASATPVPRRGERRTLRLHGRLTWRDASGTLRFVSVITRDVSDVDMFVECQMPALIPLYRLVHFQMERQAREAGEISAVYRVGPFKSSTGTPQGYALRLLVEPRGAAVAPSSRSRLAVAN